MDYTMYLWIIRTMYLWIIPMYLWIIPCIYILYHVFMYYTMYSYIAKEPPEKFSRKKLAEFCHDITGMPQCIQELTQPVLLSMC